MSNITLGAGRFIIQPFDSAEAACTAADYAGLVANAAIGKLPNSAEITCTASINSQILRRLAGLPPYRPKRRRVNEKKACMRVWRSMYMIHSTRSNGIGRALIKLGRMPGRCDVLPIAWWTRKDRRRHNRGRRSHV